MQNYELIDRLSQEFDLTEEQIKILKNEIDTPVKIIGIGQTGVGKTELLKSIFRINAEEVIVDKVNGEAVLSKLKTGSVKSVTKSFYSFTIISKEGLKVQFTDGPGLGEDEKLEKKYIDEWVNEIPKHDMLYWVLDGSSRDIFHVQKNMKLILDKTDYRNKLVVVLNKVDQILISQEDEIKGMIGWDSDLNQPSQRLLRLIEERTEDIIEKLVEFADIKKSQIVVCSARKRWNHGEVLNKILEHLPKEVAIKASRNREVKDYTELMTEKGRKKIM